MIKNHTVYIFYVHCVTSETVDLSLVCLFQLKFAVLFLVTHTGKQYESSRDCTGLYYYILVLTHILS